MPDDAVPRNSPAPDDIVDQLSECRILPGGVALLFLVTPKFDANRNGIIAQPGCEGTTWSTKAPDGESAIFIQAASMKQDAFCIPGAIGHISVRALAVTTSR